MEMTLTHEEIFEFFWRFLFSFPSLYLQNLDIRPTHIFLNSVNTLIFPNLSFLWFSICRGVAVTQPLALSGKHISGELDQPFKSKV